MTTTNNAVNTTLSGQTGTGNFVGATSPTLVTPTVGAATATSVTFSNYATGGIVGTNTNNNAAAGYVGEYITSNVPSASAVSLSNGVSANVTSISLTAGDWDVFGNVFFNSASTTAGFCWTSTTSATEPDASLIAGLITQSAVVAPANSTPHQRLSLSSTTTVYLSVLSVFSGTCTACGTISARRAR